MKITVQCAKEEWNKCCCTCFWHWEDYGHPHTNGGRVTIQRGWVCANPELWDDGQMRTMSDWGEHGLCEVWTDRNKVKLLIEYTK